MTTKTLDLATLTKGNTVRFRPHGRKNRVDLWLAKSPEPAGSGGFWHLVGYRCSKKYPGDSIGGLRSFLVHQSDQLELIDS